MSKLLSTCAAVAVFMSLPQLAAQNCANCRISTDDVTLVAGSTGTEIPVQATNSDTVLFAMSFGLTYDTSRIDITEVLRGPASTSADFFDGGIDSASGEVAYGIVWDVGTDFSTKRLPAGADHVVAILVVDALSVPGATSLTFEEVQIPAISPHPIDNVMTNPDGQSILPTLDPGTITIEDRTPVITSVSNKTGPAGHVFQVVGNFFDEPGLAVTVDGAAAAATLRVDGVTIDVTAPPSAVQGCVDVVVSTVHGSDTEVDGFCYQTDGGGATFVRGDSNSDNAVNISDAQYSLNALFLGGPLPLCPDAADTNDDGATNISDPQYTLNFLFLGGPAPAAPYPNAGEDPTADGLAACPEN